MTNQKGIGISADLDEYLSVQLERMDLYFVGTNEMVSYVLHYLHFEEWQDFMKELARTFVIFCLFGDAADDNLIQSFDSIYWKPTKKC